MTDPEKSEKNEATWILKTNSTLAQCVEQGRQEDIFVYRVVHIFLTWFIRKFELSLFKKFSL